MCEEKKSKSGVSVVIPAYNEEKMVAIVLDEVKAVMDSCGYNYEIIVIDDGSTDKTTEVLESRKGIVLIRNISNQGYGASLKLGIRRANYNFIIITDADGTYPNESILELLKYISDYDMVVAARTGGDVKMPILRKIAKYPLNFLANYLSGKKIPDLNSGLRAFKKEAVLNFSSILPSGFSFTTTITLALLVNDYAVRYISINYRHRKEMSKFHPVKDTMSMFTLIVRTILYFNPLKIFIPLSVILIISGLSVFVWSLLFLPKILDITSALLIITGIQVIAIGLLADLINKKIR